MLESYLGDVLVLGMGATGRALVQYLAPFIGGRVASLTLYGGADSEPDERSGELAALGARVVLGTDQVIGHFDLAITSPGIPMDSTFFRTASEHSDELIGEPEFAWRESPERWVGITGTNGKTTTTSLAAHLLREGGINARAVGNIGVTITGCLEDRADDEWFVAELSSFQLATTRQLHPRVAVLMNITPDHLEWHGTLEAYAAAKEHLFDNLEGDDLAVIVCGDSWSRAIADRVRARGLRVCEVSSSDEPEGDDAAFVREGVLVCRLHGCEHELLSVFDLQILGAHNWENALAASALALELGVSDADVACGLASFPPLEHRIEPCGSYAGINFVNDSKATNTDAVEKALLAFEPGSVIVLLGGHDKGTELDSLARAVADRCRVAVCYGAAGERIASALDAECASRGADCGLTVIRAPHMREAFDEAVACARPGDTVLLSPACSSFDEFSGMSERGRVFKGLVADLGQAEE